MRADFYSGYDPTQAQAALAAVKQTLSAGGEEELFSESVDTLAELREQARSREPVKEHGPTLLAEALLRDAAYGGCSRGFAMLSGLRGVARKNYQRTLAAAYAEI